MNLELDAVQQQLIDAVAKSEAEAPAEASGWDVLDTVGLSELLAPEPGARPILGTLEWCLILEELGAGCRSHTLVLSVRTLVDVCAEAGERTAAGEAFRTWVSHHRTAPGDDTALVQRAGDGVWRIAYPLRTALPGEITLDASTAKAMDDRELLLIAAYACGVARRCLEVAQERAGQRVVAGRRLLEHQGTGHRIARCAVDLTIARVGLWRAAHGEDEGERAGHRAEAAAAACVSAALDCAHTVVQVFGAAGTSDPVVVRLFRMAYSLPAVSGSPRALWQSVGARRLPPLVSRSPT
ncbi:acyl-CoA dehydrogenase family protein [Streptomyces sp. NPDC093097]|uniref:acyl-CoA dehydrogenase family protein n=1 Tax=Streptomyces sp. NPDC093097 TaxID=3366027 RepID=UPI00380AAA9C